MEPLGKCRLIFPLLFFEAAFVLERGKNEKRLKYAIISLDFLSAKRKAIVKVSLNLLKSFNIKSLEIKVPSKMQYQVTFDYLLRPT